MIHQFFDYETVKETVKEGFESDTVETDPTEPTEPTKDEEDPNSNTKLLKDVGLLIVFYILFVAIFMISGSIMFKYIIMTRMGKSVVGTISGFPDNLSYRKSSNEAYDKFFSGDKERLIDKEYDCDYFTYNHKDENNEKSKVFLPIKFSYEPYYNNWLYRHDFNTGIPGTVYSLDADMDISAGEGEVNPNILSNTFPINWFWTTFTTIFTTTNNIFANGMTATVAIIIVLLLALSNTISMVSTTIDKNTIPSVFTILTSIVHSTSTLIYIPVFILSFSSLFWSINLVNYYEIDKRMHLRFLNYPFFDYFWPNLVAKIFAICTLFGCLFAWLWFNFFIIVSQFLPTAMMFMFFTCVMCRSYGNYTYNDETKKLDFSYILFELFPIFCCTNEWIIFFMLFAFVILASAINPTIGAVTFTCMFFGILIFYTSIKKMIKSILARLTPKKASVTDVPLDSNELSEFPEVPSAAPLETDSPLAKDTDQASNVPEKPFFDPQPDLQRLAKSRELYEERQKEQAAKELAARQEAENKRTLENQALKLAALSK